MDDFKFPHSWLPGTISQIWDYCGETCAMAVLERFGGTHVCVPKNAPDVGLIEALGYEHALALVKSYGSATLVVPNAKLARQRYVQARIWHDFWHLHHKQSTIARCYGVTERWVNEICNRPDPLERQAVRVGGRVQMDLFGLDEVA